MSNRQKIVEAGMEDRDTIQASEDEMIVSMAALKKMASAAVATNRVSMSSN